ncbi:hypothetical protein DEJ50_13875 [Streptomyces venezuelae]|uniref:Uncharacterized protein n=1 Tax=Streptomyces venezuelae TaxID=54571 RepID=A0A5P2D104_STRVZ|nr:hypothetical protein [Streptomyces venezuelae]QES48746.1 hypothetical protein DEJ50_13875 [Streptomyces venezuelae]
MTTPPQPPNTPAPAAFGPPPAMRPPRARRTVLAAVLALVLLAVAVTGGWWLLGTYDEDDSPLAGRPRVTDQAAGLSYGIPEGWKQPEKQGDLINAFTSTISKESAGTVLAGRAGAIAEADLKRQTERSARSNAAFFFPDGRSTLTDSRPTEVSGNLAHTVTLKIDDGKAGTAHLRFTVTTLTADRSAFLLGLTQESDPAEREEVDTILASAKAL